MILQEIRPLYEDDQLKRIKRQDIPATLKYFSEITGIPTKDLHKVGSTGKLQSSSDIDIAIDINKYSPSSVHERMKERGKYNKSTKSASYNIPIRGDEDNGNVRVDVIYTPNVDWAKFSFHSEGENSKYKGAIRTILLAGVASALNQHGTDHFEYNKQGDLIIQAGRVVDLAKGLRRTFQSMSDGGKMKSMTIDEFKEKYPNIKVKGGQIIIDDPSKVVKMLFGSKVTPDDVRSVEQILSLIKAKFDNDTQTKIFKYAAKKAKPLIKKMRLPPELENNNAT
jgi:hypothetical protein